MPQTSNLLPPFVGKLKLSSLSVYHDGLSFYSLAFGVLDLIQAHLVWGHKVSREKSKPLPLGAGGKALLSDSQRRDRPEEHSLFATPFFLSMMIGV